MRLVATCPACGKSVDHMCQDELSERGIWLVDTFATGDRFEAPTQDDYHKLLVSRASGLSWPEAVQLLSDRDGRRIEVAEARPRRSSHREPLFLGIAVAEDHGWVTWLYTYTGLGGLIGLVNGRDLRETILDERAVLKVRVRDSDVVVEVVLACDPAIEKLLPAPGSRLLEAEVRVLKEFVDARIEAKS